MIQASFLLIHRPVHLAHMQRNHLHPLHGVIDPGCMLKAIVFCKGALLCRPREKVCASLTTDCETATISKLLCVIRRANTVKFVLTEAVEEKDAWTAQQLSHDESSSWTLNDLQKVEAFLEIHQPSKHPSVPQSQTFAFKKHHITCARRLTAASSES